MPRRFIAGPFYSGHFRLMEMVDDLGYATFVVRDDIRQRRALRGPTVERCGSMPAGRGLRHAIRRRLEPMRLLILGGTGFIGPHEVRYALARGHRITIFNRGRQKEAWPGPVEELLGDRDGDLTALEGRDWDVCIDNPTSLPMWVRDAARVLKGHVGHARFHFNHLCLCRQRHDGRRDSRAGSLQRRRRDGRNNQIAERRSAAVWTAQGRRAKRRR